MARRKIIEKAPAILTLNGVPSWSPEKKRAVKAWLRNCANWLDKYADELGPVFRARYFDR